MSEVSESVEIEATLAETWDYHFDPRRWPAWVDGFGQVLETDAYPLPGGSLRWTSNAAGRGEVTEHVLEHEPRRYHRIAFTDPQTEGELLTSFRMQGTSTVVEQELSYTLRGAGVLSRITDMLFIRSQQRGSLRRSLLALKQELEGPV